MKLRGVLSGGALWKTVLLVPSLLVDSRLLRAAPASASDRSAADVAEQVLANTALGKELSKSLMAPVASSKPPSSDAVAAPAQKHAKVDVGFTDFEHNLTMRVDSAVQKIGGGKLWTSEMRSQLLQNITSATKEAIGSTLKPLKVTIGKTWVALPQDSQKDEYVKQLHASFMPILLDALKAADSHLTESVEQVGSLSKESQPPASAELLGKAEYDIGDRLLSDHCYILDEKKPANSKRNSFCMKSVLNAMTHRLNDTLGLISMTMRFDAGAMSFAQKQAGGSLLQNGTHKNFVCTQAGDCQGTWDAKEVYGNDKLNSCSWKRMTPGWYLSGGKAPEMCLRSYPDFVSDSFKAQGVFHSCLDIASAWASIPDASQSGNFAGRVTCDNVPGTISQCQSVPGTRPGIYVDIGANIGTCVMQMLSRLDVSQVVAFEPSPANLFYMTNSVIRSIQAGNPRIKDNLMLFPKALGSERSFHKLYEQEGNAGNTGVNTTVMGKEVDGVTVETITLDEVFMSGTQPPYIHLMKLDAQGYEVKILKGGPRLLASGAVNAIHIEVAPWWLHGQKTSVLEYLSILHTNMYDIRPHQDANGWLSAPELAAMACSLDKNGTIVDMLALRNRAQGMPARTPLQCPTPV
jgi:FkbM family methyltransferase